MKGTKASRRDMMRKLRDAMPAADRARCSALIQSSFLGWLPTSITHIGLYAAIHSEVETLSLFEVLVASGRTVYFPRCSPRGSRLLEYVAVTTLDELSRGSFGVLEPLGVATGIDAVQLLVVPGLAFTRSGARLGYGAGYYDDTLAAFHGTSVGFCFAAQVVDDLPQETHDQRVGLIVTEMETLDAH